MPASPPKAALEFLDTWFAFRTGLGGLPGIQAAIRHKGKLVFSKAYGVTNETKKQKYTPRHVGHFASHSKTFAACTTLMLCADGALNLHDPIITHLPWLKKHKDKRFREVTIRDLLTHRSGIFRDGLDGTFWELEKPFPDAELLISEIMSTPLVYDPNTVTKYSNTGFGLLGLVLEAATGKPYKQLLQTTVLDKLPKLTLLPDYDPKAKVAYADGHSRAVYKGKRRVFRHAPTDAFACATGICGTAESMSQFLHVLFEENTLLPLHLRREMKSLRWPMVNSMANEQYGLGMQVEAAGGNTYLGHSGGYPGFVSQTKRWEGTDYIFSLVVNTNEGMAFWMLRSMAEIIKAVTDHFPENERASLEVTPPLMNTWGITIYIIGKKKALGFAAESTLPVDTLFVLDKRKDGMFYGESLNGYFNVNEPVQFVRKNGRVTEVMFGCYRAYETSAFLKRGKKVFQ